ncbi:Carbohydrate-responsive element-binding protein-like protein, partial [Dinothrombium tinctorium]
YLLSSRNMSILPTLPEETVAESNVSVKAQPIETKPTISDNGDFLSNLDTIVNSSPTTSSQSPFTVTTPMQTLSDQSIIKMDNQIRNEITLTSQAPFSDNPCQETTQSLSAICPIQTNTEVQNSNEVPVLPLDYCKSSEVTFEDYKWNNDSGTGIVCNESKLIPTTTATINKFVVPKPPSKQRNRIRSTSSSNSIAKHPSISLMESTSTSMTDVTSVQRTQSVVERSNSLPVYSQRRNAIGPLVNAQLMQQQQQQQQSQRQLRSPNELSQFQVNSLTFQPIVSEPPVSPQTSPTAINTESNSLIVQLLANNATVSRIRPTLGFDAAAIANEINVNQCNSSVQLEEPFKMKRKTVNSKSNNRRLSVDSHVAKSHSSPPQRSAQQINDMLTNPSYSRSTQSLPTSSQPSFNITQTTTFSRESISQNNSPTRTVGKGMKAKTDHDRMQYKEHRRVCHINAEQKRRCNIKNGFDTLRNILPSLNQNSSTKISKAAMLQRAAEHIRVLKSERQQQQEEFDMLKKQIESLNTTINVFQGQLPATGAPVSCQRAGLIKEKFEAYVDDRVSKNWKFWIFSIIMKPLLESYNNTVTTSNIDDMYQSALRWLDQNCSLLTLRPNAIAALRHLSTTTNILANPASLPEEVMETVLNKNRNSVK